MLHCFRPELRTSTLPPELPAWEPPAWARTVRGFLLRSLLLRSLLLGSFLLRGFLLRSLLLRFRLCFRFVCILYLGWTVSVLGVLSASSSAAKDAFHGILVPIMQIVSAIAAAFFSFPFSSYQPFSLQNNHRSSRKYGRPRLSGGWFSRLFLMPVMTSTMMVTT